MRSLLFCNSLLLFALFKVNELNDSSDSLSDTNLWLIAFRYFVL